MAIELNYKQEAIDTTNDNIIISKYISGLNGGVCVDVDSKTYKELFSSTIISAGTPLYQYNDSQDGGKVKYIPAIYSSNEGGSFTVPSDTTAFIGVAAATVDASKSGVPVMTRGDVNCAALPEQNGKPIESVAIKVGNGNANGITFMNASNVQYSN